MNNKYTYNDFDIDLRKPLGKGSFGEVYEAKEKKSNTVYAIKRILFNKFDKEKDKEIEKEINIMLDMNKCDNSIKYVSFFKDDNYFYLIMEKCDYNLEHILEQKKFNVKEIKELLEQLNNVFKVMHDNSIIHRDIKPENILIKKLDNDKYLYKLTDYGLSKQLFESYNATTFAGTLEYMAPEIKNNLNIDKSKVDLYSIGILIHKLYFGNTPKNNIIQKTNNIYLDDLIKKLIVEKPFDKNKNNCRISWEDYFNHNFFKNNYKKEIVFLKKSLEKFDNRIKEMIAFINIKLEEFKNLINKEIGLIFTDEYNEKIKELSKLLNGFDFNNNEIKFNEMFMILNKSILKENKILEYKVYLEKSDEYIDGLYEGETIKGTNIKHGKGIEYQINLANLKKIKFIGEYLNGKRWNGKGKEYNENGKKEFEGEYLNGERNGNGKEYYNDGNIKFEGEYFNGKKWNGKVFNNNKIIFEIVNGNGKIKEYYSDGTIEFEGDYLNGERNGKGKEFYYEDGIFPFCPPKLSPFWHQSILNVLLFGGADQGFG